MARFNDIYLWDVRIKLAKSGKNSDTEGKFDQDNKTLNDSIEFTYKDEKKSFRQKQTLIDNIVSLREIVDPEGYSLKPGQYFIEKEGKQLSLTSLFFGPDKERGDAIKLFREGGWELKRVDSLDSKPKSSEVFEYRFAFTQYGEIDADKRTFQDAVLPTEMAIRQLVRRSVSHGITKLKLEHNTKMKKIFGVTADEQESFCGMFDPYDNVQNTGGCVLLKLAGPAIKTRVYNVNGCELLQERNAKRRKVVQLHVPQTDKKRDHGFGLFGSSDHAMYTDYEVLAGSLYQPAHENLLTLILNALQFRLPIKLQQNGTNYFETILTEDLRTTICDHHSISMKIKTIQNQLDQTLTNDFFEEKEATATTKETNAVNARVGALAALPQINDPNDFYTLNNRNNLLFFIGNTYDSMCSILERLHATDPILFCFGIPRTNYNRERFAHLHSESVKAVKKSTNLFSRWNQEEEEQNVDGAGAALQPPIPNEDFIAPNFKQGIRSRIAQNKVTQEEEFRSGGRSKLELILPELVYVRPTKSDGSAFFDSTEERWTFADAIPTNYRQVGIVTLSMWKKAMRTQPFCERIPQKMNRLQQMGFDTRQRTIGRAARARFDTFPKNELEFHGLLLEDVSAEDPSEYDKVVSAYEVDRDRVNVQSLIDEFEQTIRLVLEALLCKIGDFDDEDTVIKIPLKDILTARSTDWKEQVMFRPLLQKDGSQSPFDDTEEPMLSLRSFASERKRLLTPLIDGKRAIDVSPASALQFEYAATKAENSANVEERFFEMMTSRKPFGEVEAGVQPVIERCINYVLTELESARKLRSETDTKSHCCFLYQASNLVGGQSAIHDDFGMPFEPVVITFDSPRIDSKRELVYCIGSEPNMVCESIILASKMLQLFGSSQEEDGNPTITQKLSVDPTLPFPEDENDFEIKANQDNASPSSNTFTFEKDRLYIINMDEYYKLVGSTDANIARQFVVKETMRSSSLEPEDKTAPGYFENKSQLTELIFNGTFSDKHKFAKNERSLVEDGTNREINVPSQQDRIKTYAKKIHDYTNALRSTLMKVQYVDPESVSIFKRLDIPIRIHAKGDNPKEAAETEAAKAEAAKAEAAETEAEAAAKTEAFLTELLKDVEVEENQIHAYLCLETVQCERDAARFKLKGNILGIRVLESLNENILYENTINLTEKKVTLGIPGLDHTSIDVPTFNVDPGRSNTLQQAYKEAQIHLETDLSEQYRQHQSSQKGYVKTPEEVMDCLLTGFQGFHYSNLKSLQRTVFAVAMRRNLAKVMKWCSTKAILDEPRAVNLQLINKADDEFSSDFTARENRRDAKLMTLIRNGDRAQQFRVFGGATGAVSYGDRFASTLVTPAIVLVRGPGPTALTTPCRIASFCCKTAVYRLVETQVVEKLYTRVRQVRSRPASVRDDCLYDHLRRRQLRTTRMLINMRPQIIEPLAKLFLECHNQNRTTERTSQAYSRQALVMQEAAIANLVEQVLFHA